MAALHRQVAIVTGEASGIGESIAAATSAKGLCGSIAGASIDPTKADKLAGLVKAALDVIEPIPGRRASRQQRLAFVNGQNTNRGDARLLVHVGGARKCRSGSGPRRGFDFVKA